MSAQAAGAHEMPRMRPFLPEASGARSSGWPTILRGALSILFGIPALTSPQSTALAFVILFAIWAFSDAVLAFVTAASRGRAGLRWGWVVFEGVVSLAAGIVAVTYPRITILSLVIVVGLRALALGGLEVGAAIAWHGLPSRWLQALAGILSILFGLMLLWRPLAGALALLWTVGIYSLVFGITMLALGIHALGRRRSEVSGPLAPAR